MVTRTLPGWSPGISRLDISTHIYTPIYAYLHTYLQLQPGPGDGAGLHPRADHVPAGPQPGPGQQAGRVLHTLAAVILITVKTSSIVYSSYLFYEYDVAKYALSENTRYPLKLNMKVEW